MRFPSSLLPVLTLALVAVTPAGAAPTQLRPSLQRVLERDVAGTTFGLDCTYAAKGAEGIAFPQWKGLAAQVYVKPHVCTDANAAATGSPERTGAALLVLVHEALHVAGVTDETAAECAALARVPELARKLKVPASKLPGVAAGAAARHARLLAEHPAYGGCA